MQKIFGHRGASGYAPENTLEAFQLAIRQGAQGIELDVHICKDGELVVAHDEKVDRVSNGHGLIRDMTLAELRDLDFSKPKAGLGYGKLIIPTLREVFALIKPTLMEINVEMKNSEIDYPDMEKKCLALAQEMGMQDKIIYSSFNHDSVVRMKRLSPSARCGILYDTMENAWEYAYAHIPTHFPWYFVRYHGKCVGICA